MKEEFLHHLWRLKRFEIKNLKSVSNEEIQIIHGGFHNHNSGPDFENARIRIGSQVWAGNVEIHVRSSDWLKHKHQNDPAYNNVILHVVYEYDQEIFIGNNLSPIPTIVLDGRFNEKLYLEYEKFLNNSLIIPCASQLSTVDSLIRESMIDRVLVERLEQKAQIISELLTQNKQDWNETFYQWISRGFGLKVNADPMLDLAQNIPQQILGKHKDNLFQLEAILFGVSGLIEEGEDDYTLKLAKEFKFLSHKYQLKELEKVIWKFSRIRPMSFPTLRLAQFAAMIFKSENLFSEILGIGDIKSFQNLFDLEVSEYWNTHYRFGNSTEMFSGTPGEEFINIQIINVIVPFLFIYSTIKKEPFYKQRALDILDQLKPENNKITKVFKDLGFSIDSGYRSQAIIQLDQYYCKPKKCLNCSIGTHLLK